jgi:hypothetical protein
VATDVISIDDELAAYESIRQNLEANHIGQWLLMRNREVISFFERFEDAAKVAVGRFGRGPYLIRQIGAPPVVLPASMMYSLPASPENGQVHGQNQVRIR